MKTRYWIIYDLLSHPSIQRNINYHKIMNKNTSIIKREVLNQIHKQSDYWFSCQKTRFESSIPAACCVGQQTKALKECCIAGRGIVEQDLEYQYFSSAWRVLSNIWLKTNFNVNQYYFGLTQWPQNWFVVLQDRDFH